MSAQRFTRRAARHVVLIPIFVFLLAPVVIMVITSLKPYSEVYAYPPTLVPNDPTLGGFTGVLDAPYDFGRAFVNSCIIGACTAVLSMGLGAPAAYAVVRFRFPGRGLFLFAVLATQMVSAAFLVQPIYDLAASLDLLNTYVILVVGNTAFALPVVIWLLSGYLEGVPRALEEAAMVDGASRLTALRRVLLPVAAPGILAAGSYAFVHAWNDLVLALAFVTSPDMQPVTRALDRFASESIVHWELTMAASAFAILPVAILFGFLQRRLVNSLAVGSVKG